MDGCEYNHQVLSICTPVMCVSSSRNAYELRPHRPSCSRPPAAHARHGELLKNSAAEMAAAGGTNLHLQESYQKLSLLKEKSSLMTTYTLGHRRGHFCEQHNPMTLPQTPGRTHRASLPVPRAPPAHSALTHSQPCQAMALGTICEPADDTVAVMPHRH